MEESTETVKALSEDESSEKTIREEMKSDVKTEKIANGKTQHNIPPYPDIAKLSQIDFKNDNIKLSILQNQWEDVSKFTFPSRLVFF